MNLLINTTIFLIENDNTQGNLLGTSPHSSHVSVQCSDLDRGMNAALSLTSANYYLINERVNEASE